MSNLSWKRKKLAKNQEKILKADLKYDTDLECTPRKYMTLAEYQAIAAKGIKSVFDGGDYKQQQALAILGLLARAGKLAEFGKNSVSAESAKPSPELLRGTIGEVLFYCASLCTLYGISIDEVAVTNLETLKKIHCKTMVDFKPDEYSR